MISGALSVSIYHKSTGAPPVLLQMPSFLVNFAKTNEVKHYGTTRSHCRTPERG